jgi:Uri superfamily endonuclease
MPFGRFKKGTPITIPRGECLYVGSALIGLAQRLVRHASRSNAGSPHPIRALMLDLFPQIGLGSRHLVPVSGKRLHWHVDHLLDREQILLNQVFVLRGAGPLEASLGRILEREATTFIIERGLGANDIPGNTHLLGVRAPEAWWRSLPARLEAMLMDMPPASQSEP